MELQNIALEKVGGLIEHMNKAGLQPFGGFIVGFPHETKEQIKRTMDLATQLNLDRISIGILTPLAGSQFYDYCVENNLLYENFNFEESTISIPSVKFDHISGEELVQMRQEVWRTYMSGRKNMEYLNYPKSPGVKENKINEK